ncbi:pseudouridine synthase [Aspergillus egyptiacus]|nr:pseudouridine synthase [Aspergillus egyptiacus]
MWRIQAGLPTLLINQAIQEQLPSLLRLSRPPRRQAHKGLAALDALAKEIMSGNNPVPPAPPPKQPDYSTWSTSSLIERISELERQLHSRTTEYATATTSTTTSSSSSSSKPGNAQPQAQPPAEVPRWLRIGKYDPNDFVHAPGVRLPKPVRKMDPSNYNFRYIALKFAYLGQRYNGLEHANGNITRLPTVEEEMWKALRKTRLIFPTGMEDEGLDLLDSRSERKIDEPFTLSWEGCEYSKAGRTDRGVSAFGQVIGIKVRSARPKAKVKEGEGDDVTMDNTDDGWDDIADELPYIALLNKSLPEDIRVLAWCPHPPEGFDARFSCRERHYKYFFTQPAFSPTPGPFGFASRGENKSVKYREGWLDIEAMREAAKYFEGVHDFRNFCKVDTSKQIENFERIIYRADIELLDPKSTPLAYLNRPEFQASEKAAVEMTGDSQTSYQAGNQVYAVNIQGSAFLWHQVRHMVGILFLVGQGLEPPSIVPALLDVSKNPRKPIYEMASDAPLVLWDCIFPEKDSKKREDALEWVYAGDPRQVRSQYAKGGGKFGMGGVVEDLWSVWRQRKMDEILAGALLNLVVQQGDQSGATGQNIKNVQAEKDIRGQKVFSGANLAKTGGKYIPVMQKRKIETVEVLNARYLAAKQRKLERNGQASNASA